MAAEIASAKLTLDYPLYACDFDPQDANRLVVGGGGGAGRSGVGNKISVIDTSTKDELRIAGDIALSRDEDSVTTLAVGPRKGKATLIYAGVNSSPADVARGTNEHFRTFGLEQSKARASVGASTASARLTELARTSLLATRNKDTYQRVLRLSPPFGTSPQVGAVSTGLAATHQVAVFDVAAGATGPRARGTLELDREAVDLDVLQVGEEAYQVAYCDEHEVYALDVGKGVSDGGPRLVFSMPHDQTGGTAPRPEFRALRYLTSGFMFAVANLRKRSGVVLSGIRLPSGEQKMGRLAVTHRLPKAVASATALAVRNLSSPASPSARTGPTQFIIAVAGHDSSISLFSLEHTTHDNFDFLIKLQPLAVLKEVHPLQITGLSFSVFTPPKTTTARAQFLKLASISMGNTLVVHSIPLRKFIDKSVPIRKGGPPRPVRYVVGIKTRQFSLRSVIVVSTFFVVVMAILAQLALESYGVTRPILLPAPRVAQNLPNEFLSTLLGDVKAAQGDRIVLREDAVSPVTPGADVPVIQADVHDAEVHGPAVGWDELSAKEKKLWKRKLTHAGHWAEEMGENVFKGVLFGELAGAVGRAVGG